MEMPYFRHVSTAACQSVACKSKIHVCNDWAIAGVICMAAFSCPWSSKISVELALMYCWKSSRSLCASCRHPRWWACATCWRRWETLCRCPWRWTSWRRCCTVEGTPASRAAAWHGMVLLLHWYWPCPLRKLSCQLAACTFQLLSAASKEGVFPCQRELQRQASHTNPMHSINQGCKSACTPMLVWQHGCRFASLVV